MRWILLDVVLALLGLGLLALVGLSLWRQVKALGQAAQVAGAQFAQVSAQLQTLSERDRPMPVGTHGAPQVPAARTPRGVPLNRPS